MEEPKHHAVKSKQKEKHFVASTEEEKLSVQVDDESKETGGKAPKPFLKRKTMTMQPAKINWKTKSRIDCWGGASKTSKKELISSQKFPQPHKTLIEAQ